MTYSLPFLRRVIVAETYEERRQLLDSNVAAGSWDLLTILRCLFFGFSESDVRLENPPSRRTER